MSENSKDSLVLYRTQLEAMDCIPDADDRWAFFRKFTQYAMDGTEPSFENPLEKAIFLSMRPNIDNAIKRYDASVSNGKKGGRPPKKIFFENKPQTPTFTVVPNPEPPVIEKQEEPEYIREGRCLYGIK